MRLLDLLVAAAALAASVLAAMRWLRVAQREGWAPFAASAWAVRWWLLPHNVPVAVVALGSLVAAPVLRPTALATAVAVAAGPFGLALRGRRPGPLRWTSRCRRTAATAAATVLVVTAAGLAVGPGTGALVATVCAVLAPILVDLAAVAAGGPEPAEGAVPTGPAVDDVLGELAAAPEGGRRVVVAGGPAGAAGRSFAQRAAGVASHLLIVGRHAQADLQAGAADGPPGCTIVLCHDVDHAAAWVEAETEQADTVRWLSLPPDHVP